MEPQRVPRLQPRLHHCQRNHISLSLHSPRETRCIRELTTHTNKKKKKKKRKKKKKNKKKKKTKSFFFTLSQNHLNTTIERGDIKFNKLEELISRNNVGYINEYGNTALITACIYDKSYIALELIKTGKSKPEHINNDGNNALFFAFKHRMKDLS